MHAGSPENFVYHKSSGASGNGYRVEYLLSSGQRQENYSTLSTGEKINLRDWNIYRDKTLDAKGYINNVHIMPYDEAYAIDNSGAWTTSGTRLTGGTYWLASAYSTNNLSMSWQSGTKCELLQGPAAEGSFGIRPVIEMNEGVYIVSGSGTENSPYILGKE